MMLDNISYKIGLIFQDHKLYFIQDRSQEQRRWGVGSLSLSPSLNQLVFPTQFGVLQLSQLG